MPACLFVCLSVCRCWCCMCAVVCLWLSWRTLFPPHFNLIFVYLLGMSNMVSLSVFQWNWICLQLFLMVIVVSAVCCRPNHLVSKKNANRSISIHFINIVKCRKFTNCIKCTLLLSIPMWMCLPVFMCSPLCLLFCVTYFVSIFLKSSHLCTLSTSNSNWR